MGMGCDGCEGRTVLRHHPPRTAVQGLQFAR